MLNPIAGEFRLRNMVNGTWSDIVPWTSSLHINRGEATNQVRVVASGTKLQLFINSERVAALSDTKFKTGKIALYAQNISDPQGANSFFDDFELYTFLQVAAPPPLPESPIYLTTFSPLGSEATTIGTEIELFDAAVVGDTNKSIWYLDGRELSVFHWTDAQSQDCPIEGQRCATILVNDGYRDWAGTNRPHWGEDVDQRRTATVFLRLRDMAINYFDAHNQIATPIRDVEDVDELVVMVDRPDSVPCSGSCMRPWRSAGDMDPRFQVFRTIRPDGNNEWAPYHMRPKIFLSLSGGRTLRVQTHEFGHYYHRVFVEKYGAGGGFYRHGSHQEKALDEGLTYWYASDYTDIFYLGRWNPKNPVPPKYDQFSDSSTDVHRLGDVINSAFWHVRELPGTDIVGWREIILSLVDRLKPDEFTVDDALGGSSILRGFAHRAFVEAASAGVFSDENAQRLACEIMVNHQLDSLSSC